MKKFIVLGLLIAVFNVQAEEAIQSEDILVIEQVFDLTWITPTTRVGGTVLTKEEILRYNVYWSPDAVDYVVIGGTTDEFYTVKYYLPTGPEAYTYLYKITTVDTNNQESEFSNIHLETFIVKPSSLPAAPGNLDSPGRRGIGCIIDSITVVEGMGISAN